MTGDVTSVEGEAAIRAEVRAWLAEHWSPELALREWWARLAESGWGNPTWPVEVYGRGLSDQLGLAVQEEIAAVGAPAAPHGAAHSMGAPCIFQFGTPEQQRRLLAKPVLGEENWCQLFSEPGAGSDLASAQTRAVRDGDDWIVNGQKIWTSSARTADHGLLVARTDPELPKHKGLGYFIMPIDQPGVEIRPIKQLNGDAHFNEVFFTDARVPDANLIGGPNAGWACAMTTLGHERNLNAAGLEGPRAIPAGEKSGYLDRRVADILAEGVHGEIDPPFPIASSHALIELARERGRLGDAMLRQALMRLHCLVECGRYTALRLEAARQAGRELGPESSIGYLAGVQRARASRDVAFAVMGAAGLLDGASAPKDGAVLHMALSTLAHGIQGGSEQIQRNIIGERVLGLAREPQVDRDVPFKDLKVGTQRSTSP